MKAALAVLVVALVANIVTLGAPGGVLYAIGDGIASLVLPQSLGDVHGDYLWPISFWMGIAWPFGAFLMFVLFARSVPDGKWTVSVSALFLLSLLILNIALSVMFHLGGALASPDYVIEEKLR